MKIPYTPFIQKVWLFSAFFLMIMAQQTFAQKATAAFPIGIGSPCNANGTSQDSVKYFDYNSTTNLLTFKSKCQPVLAAPGFSDRTSSISFNPYDGFIYYTQFALVGNIYNSYTYRWLPATCPNAATLPVYKTFINQLIIGVEFDPATGLGYQINFVDSTGVPPFNPDAAGNIGQYTSGAIVNGMPAMAYYDVSNGDLKYVISTDVNGRAWGTPVTVANTGTVGQYISLAVVNGNPAISYYDATNGDLKFVRAADAAGTAWGVPLTLDATGNTGQYTSMTIVNGNPAVSYYDVSNADLRYIRATDAIGTVWGAPVSVATAGSVGQYNSMKVVNGNPAISYYDATNGDLMYVAAINASGTTWALPVTAEAPNNVGTYTSLVVVNGNPAISYYDVTNGDLRYVRSTNAAGTAWSTGMAVANTGNVGTYTSMAIVNGNPAISYYDVTNQDLKYIRSTDANGTAWGLIKTPEATNNVGQFTSLLVVNGYPSIFYYDVTNGDPRYIQSKNINGDMWYFNSGIAKMELQQVNFTTSAVGASKPIDFGSRYIYQQNGDVVMTPGGQMVAVYDNKYLTINWKNYTSGAPLVATFIDTLNISAGNSLVGLAYSDGKLVSSILNNTTCNSSYQELDILTGAQSPITYNAGATLYVSTDMTDITSGIGAAKKLISATENPVGSKTYDVVYDVVIKNIGSTTITNVQAYDTLSQINGAGNVLSASVSSVTGPAGITKNNLYDGKTAGNFNLLTTGNSLSNIPGQNTITIQITCKIANIQPGVVYNNQAVASGTGLFGDNIRDSSTNGSNPDLNSNDKTDDPGESQATPLLISVTAQTPPCVSLTNILYAQDFGTGTGLVTIIPTPFKAATVTSATGVSMYNGSNTAPIASETYTITNNAQNANTTDFLNLADHTGNGSGRMLVVNADAANTVLYSGNFQGPLCANQQYSLSFFAAFPGNTGYQTKCNAFGGFVFPKIKVVIRDGLSGLIIAQVSTSIINSSGWQQYGLKFVSPASYTNIIMELVNDAPGGCGNDVLIDDIQFGSCDALPVVNVGAISGGCLGSSTTFVSNLSDPAALPGSKDYQWQIASSAAGPYVNIAGATAANYTISSIAASDTGKYYKVIIAATGNIGTPNCQYVSPALYLPGKTLSVAPTGATKNKNNICAGIAVNLSVTGGTLGTNAQWQWYSGSCGGTFAGTGATITVTPSVTTTYYVRAEGDCNNTTCQQVTVFISCNIDKDKDGIPDFVESNMPLALQDANNNGIINAYDPAYAGFTDNNNNFINDNFEADGDSDNDGVPNYLDTDFAGRTDINNDGKDDRFDTDKDGIINMLDLDSDNDGVTDVAEAGGTDTDGDGKLDNFTDSDFDGLSDQVDANLFGAYNSGKGLGLADLDADGVPNFLDLDSDNDGIPDVVEVMGADTNNDGKIDGFTDSNMDGIHDNYINANALLKTGADTNGDGFTNSYPNKNLDNDGRANPYDADSDGDGITDVIESGLGDANYDGWIDGVIGTDGWSNTVKAKATLNLRNTDGRGNPDYLDIDADDDGIPDNIEGMSTNTYLLPSGADSDNDGLDNSYDSRVGFGGPGIFVYDHDSDGTPDYIDLDTDADGRADIIEGNDFNRNGMSDDNVTLTLLDTDGDGLDNRFDSLNSVTNIKGTSYNLGNGGSVSGDAMPGSRTTVQRTNNTQSDRDWRSVGTVLFVKLFDLTGTRQTYSALLKWDIFSYDKIDRFEIERSQNNASFTRIATVSDSVVLNQLQSFIYSDDIYGVNAENILYRVKAVSVHNGAKYSNTYVVKQSTVKQSLKVAHNAAGGYINISFFSENEDNAEIRLFDAGGKMLLKNTQPVYKGNNAIKLMNLDNYPEGVYTIQVLANHEITTAKLLLLTTK